MKPASLGGALRAAWAALLLELVVAGSGLAMAADPAQLGIEAIAPEESAGALAEGEWTLYLNGEFDAAAPARLAALVAQRKISRASVYLNSTGGSLLAAMAIGRLLREHEFDTHVGRRAEDPRQPAPGACYSACPFAFAGGRRRFLDAGAIIGVHRTVNRVPVPDELAFEQVVSAQATSYLGEMGVSPELFHIMQNMPRDGIFLLTPDEAVRLNLATDRLSAVSSQAP